ncbi:zinc finger BED domain-containing protein RICESLEEPER 3 [Tanacetum coccineum]
MCIMTDGHKKAQCKFCFHFFAVGSNTTLKNHISHPHCEVLKAQQNQNPEAGQTTMGRDGQVFMYNPDYLREQFAGLVIQRGLPFNHFDNEQTTRVFQNNMQRAHSNFVRGLQPKDYESYDVLGFWKTKENQFPVLSRMALDILSVQASSVASESAFSTSGRILSIRRTRLTAESLEMCMCLKDHLDAHERRQHTTPLELPLDVEEGVFNDEVQMNEATQLTDQEIALDASSDGSFEEPPRDYMLSSGAEDDETQDGAGGSMHNGHVSLVLRIDKILPLVENADSDATEEAWTLNISRAMRDRTGKLIFFVFQNPITFIIDS